MTNPTPEYLTVAEAAEREGVARQTVWRWIKSGRLSKHKRATSRTTYVRADELSDAREPKEVAV